MSSQPVSRREVVKLGVAAAAAGSLTRFSRAASATDEPLFQISLAEWSLHRAIHEGRLEHLDFPKTAKNDYGIDAVEYVNTLFKKRGDAEYTKELKKRCEGEGVKSVLIMCDDEGDLGDADPKKRKQTVENHKKWLEAAATLGCHSIRVNARGMGTYEEQQAQAADGLHALCVVAEPFNLNVIVENHGGLSSNGKWLSEVMKKVGHPRVGTLPDFGNFRISADEQYDRYKGVEEMMPFAKGVSAKSHDFDDATGEEKDMDYTRLMRIVLAAGYHGRLGVEYEGSRLSEPDGIRATKRLLEKVRDELSKPRK
ncbi:MAG: TIM barrel protein [Planctomycetes bacterium]|nr:TIM barrel protein [Planctomycetota bacterium]